MLVLVSIRNTPLEHGLEHALSIRALSVGHVQSGGLECARTSRFKSVGKSVEYE